MLPFGGFKNWNSTVITCIPIDRCVTHDVLSHLAMRQEQEKQRKEQEMRKRLNEAKQAEEARRQEELKKQQLITKDKILVQQQQMLVSSSAPVVRHISSEQTTVSSSSTSLSSSSTSGGDVKQKVLLMQQMIKEQATDVKPPSTSMINFLISVFIACAYSLVVGTLTSTVVFMLVLVLVLGSWWRPIIGSNRPVVPFVKKKVIIYSF